MKTRLIFVVAILAVFAFSTCKKENMCDCIKRTGDIVRETRTVDHFIRIYVEDRINVVLTEDTTLAQEVVVEAGENLVPLIVTEVVNGTLRISNNNKCNFTRKYNIPITVYVRTGRDLERITNYGTALVSNTDTCTSPTIYLDTESAGDINLMVSGGIVFTYQHSQGDIELHGNLATLNIYNTGGGFTITDDCISPYVFCYTRTTGKITVYPRDQLDCEIQGIGNVYYRGTPILINKIEGDDGRVLPLQ